MAIGKRAADERGLAPAGERAFERKLRLTTWAMLFESLWPRACRSLALAGLWPLLPERPHKIVLAAFGLLLAAALIGALRVRRPTREQAMRRLEARSGIKHRPASSYEDRLTLGAEDARTAALWRMHRQRL